MTFRLPPWRWPDALPEIGARAGAGPFAPCIRACGRWTFARYGVPFDLSGPRRAPRWPGEQVPADPQQPGCVPVCITCALAIEMEQAA